MKGTACAMVTGIGKSHEELIELITHMADVIVDGPMIAMLDRFRELQESIITLRNHIVEVLMEDGIEFGETAISDRIPPLTWCLPVSVHARDPPSGSCAEHVNIRYNSIID